MRKLSVIVVLVLIMQLVSGCSFLTDVTEAETNVEAEPGVVTETDVETEPAAETEPGDETVPDEAVETGSETNQEIGVYEGQIDSNFIELSLTNESDEIYYEAFMLSDEVRESFSSLSLTSGDDVEFEYFVNENDQKVITQLSK